MSVGNSFLAAIFLLAVGVHLQEKSPQLHYIEVGSAELYPDGVKKTVLTYNGLFPGPVFGVLKGESIAVSLYNNHPSGEPTTIHWHGIFQNHSQFEDGPAMISQCPLPYSHTQLYNFTLEQTGTHWYHSHYYGQYADGLFGAILGMDGPLGIYDKEKYEYEFDAVVILSDHYHADYKTNQRQYMNTAFPPKPQSALINGHGVYHCRTIPPLAPISFGAIYQGTTCRTDLLVRSVYRVHPNRMYRFRVVNAAALSPFTFSIDYHTLWTMEVDGVLVHPDALTETTHAVIAPGQSYSFLVEMNQPEGKYSIRAVMKNDLAILDGTPLQLSVTAEELFSHSTTAALIYDPKEEYTPGEHDFLPRLTEPVTLFQDKYFHYNGPVFTKQTFVDEMTLLPRDGMVAPGNVAQFLLNLKLTRSEDLHILSLINGTRFKAPVYEPLIFTYMRGKQLPNESNPIEIQWMQSVQLIVNNKEPFAHPMHLHGHDFWILGKGAPFTGDYNPDLHSAQLKTATVRRNVVMVNPLSWVVLRFIANNEGVWPFHCHIDWHYLGGMTVVFVSGQENFLKNHGGKENRTENVPPQAKFLCRLNGINF